MTSIVPIVEGFGDVEAVPILLRRVLQELHGRYDVTVAKPIRVPRGKLVKPAEVERAVRLAVLDRHGTSAVLVVFDEDDDDATEIENGLHHHLDAVAPVPVRVRIAVREYESWLLGAKESLRGHQGIRKDALAPANPEGIRDAKGELQANMEQGRKYLETVDQAKLTAWMDLGAAQRACPSFARLIVGVGELAALI